MYNFLLVMMQKRTNPLRCMQGQASVFVVALIGVVLIAAIFLYQSGRLTSEKMQLQNGADAAAFGASTLEARSLNFCAYTNRAMVANEVAVGQMVGLLSMADEVKSLGEYLQAYGVAIEAATAWLFAIIGPGDVIEGVISAIVTLIEEAGEIIEEVGESIAKVLEAIITPVVLGLSVNNEVYSVSQTLYHGATMVLVTANVFKSLEDNTYGSTFHFADLFARNRSGAQVSDVGLLALALHMPSSWSGYTKRYSPLSEKKKSDENIESEGSVELGQETPELRSTRKKSTGKEKKKQKDSTKEQQKGMERFAATVREARDPFTSGGIPIRARNFLGMDVEYKNRDWFLGLELNEHFHFSAEVFSININLSESLGVRSKGGSELMSKGEGYSWVALDTLLGGPAFSYDIKGSIGIPPLDVSKHWKGSVELGLPLGGGISQAAEAEGSSNALTPVDMDVPNPLDFYSKSFKPFGGAGSGERMIMVETASKDLEENTVTGYTGLKPYRDRPADKAKEDPANPPVVPFQSPFFLVGATRQMDDITDKGPQFSGNLDLIYDKKYPIQSQVSAIAKSQIYFSRPKDLRYFLRLDKKEEKSNVFSPFWQPRLVKTTDLDRLMVLALQDHVLWIPGQLQKDIPGMQKVITFLEDIFKLFR